MDDITTDGETEKAVCSSVSRRPKSHMPDALRGNALLVQTAKLMWREGGGRAFFRGLFPSLLGITHVAVQFPLYEFLKKWASEYQILLSLA